MYKSGMNEASTVNQFHRSATGKDMDVVVVYLIRLDTVLARPAVWTCQDARLVGGRPD